MSTYHTAQLVYGIDLGSSDEHLIAEVGEFGSLNLPWVHKDEDGWATETLTEAFTRRLYETIPGADPSATDSWDRGDLIKEHYGVEVLEHGWLAEGDTASYALIAHKVEADGGDAERVDLPELMSMQSLQSFDQKLDRALDVLDITPINRRGWLLLATR